MSKASQSGWELTHLAFVARRQLKLARMFTLRAFACIGEYAEVGDNTVKFIRTLTIGRRCQRWAMTVLLYANSTIYHDCRVGNHCILHSGCVIGADGFGFAPTSDGL